MHEQNLDQVPFARLLGIELNEVDEGLAVASLDLTEEHASNPRSGIVHGGVPYTLADTVAGIAASTLCEGVAPTIDMRIDYLKPTLGGSLRAEAGVVRSGSSVSTVDIEVTNGQADLIATARGTFKTGGSGGDSPWEAGHHVDGNE